MRGCVSSAALRHVCCFNSIGIRVEGNFVYQQEESGGPSGVGFHGGGGTLEKPVQNKVVIIGAGSAGITFALQVADAGIHVDLYTKEKTSFDHPESSSSILLAGGYAAVPLENGIPLTGDSIETHVQDTLTVGGGLNSERAVRYYVQKFPGVINWLKDRGITFDRDLHSEGSHSASRIYHVSDRTGETVMGRLGELVLGHPNIVVYPNHMVIDLITENKMREENKLLDTCLGAYVLDMQTNEIKTGCGKCSRCGNGWSWKGLHVHDKS